MLSVKIRKMFKFFMVILVIYGYLLKIERKKPRNEESILVYIGNKKEKEKKKRSVF